MLLYLKYGEQPSRGKDFPKISEVSRDGAYAELEIGGYRYWWPASCDHRSLAWIRQEVFAPATRNPYAYEFGGAFIRPGDWVLDGGTCEGFFTRYALQRGANVLAVEPVDLLLQALGRTFEPEVRAGAVRVLPGALGEISGEARVEIRTTNLWESTISAAGTVLSQNGQRCRTYCIDDLLAQRTVPVLDFIKMDVEGAEVSAIRGARQTLQEHKPRLAIAVYHDLDNARQVADFVRSVRPDYHIRCRGIYAWEGCAPRPVMVFAW